MADIQYEGARKLLAIIAAADANQTYVTYMQAAAKMGRMPPQSHSKTIAAMCNLLDAAACLAGVPALALVKVREEGGTVNWQAWRKEYPDGREAIINRSLGYRFGPSDYAAIKSALGELGGRGDRKAWKYLGTLYPGDLQFRRLIGDYANPYSDAINDIGTDFPDRSKSEVSSYARDPRVREAVLRRANGRCERCGQLGFKKADGTRYLETHHVIALAREGSDRVTNVIGVCANDHREAHFGEKSREIEAEMILKLEALNAVTTS